MMLYVLLELIFNICHSSDSTLRWKLLPLFPICCVAINAIYQPDLTSQFVS